MIALSDDDLDPHEQALDIVARAHAATVIAASSGHRHNRRHSRRIEASEVAGFDRRYVGRTDADRRETDQEPDDDHR